MKKIKMTSILMLGLGIFGAHAQDAVLTAGGEAFGSGGTASYSVGQVIYTEASGSGGISTQGVQQTYVIATDIKESPFIHLSVSVYPNPAISTLTLKIDEAINEKLTYGLYDMGGKKLASEQITSNQTIIPMQHLAPASYTLLIHNKQQTIKTFKITKTN